MRAWALWSALGIATFLAGAASPSIFSSGDAMAGAARRFVATLDARQREQALVAFDDAERRNWHFVPRSRRGLALRDMSEVQRRAAHDLLRSALSSGGYLKATGVLQLEAILRDLEDNAGRDPGLYHVTVFGEPGSGPWGWRVEGHHLSLNFSAVADERAATTPSFLGANPAEVADGPHAGWRLLSAEEDLGRELLRSLDAGQRQQAVIAEDAPADILFGPGKAPDFDQPVGLPWSAMNAEQHALLWRLIQEYANNLRADLAKAQLARISPGNADELRFAWAGGAEPGQGHYYRISGPTFVIEYDNTQGGANHVHTCWRDRDDFGEDLLRRHHAEQHPK